MNIEYYAGQSIVDTPKKKEDADDKAKARSRKSETHAKEKAAKREKIAMVNGKLVVVSK